MPEGQMLYPHRMVWPAFWGTIKDDKISPLNPEAVAGALRRPLGRPRGDTFAESMMDVRLSTDDKVSVLGEERAKVSKDEWTEEEQAKLAELERTKGMEEYREKLIAGLEGLKSIVTDESAVPVFVSGGKVRRLADDGNVEEFEHEDAKPYAWKLAHNVRPARLSSGIKGCYECHSLGSPIFDGRVTALGPAPDDNPTTHAMYELAGLDKQKLDAWSLSFLGRTSFKYFGFASMSVVALILLSMLVCGVNSVLGRERRP
jgi:hypothetical protein